MTIKKQIIIASICGALAVALGAFGAHGLKPLLNDAQMHTYQTAVQYHFYHTLSMLLMISFMNRTEFGIFKISFYLFLTGIICFSGSLYLISTTDITGLGINRILGPVTPLGGVFFILGWLNLIRVKFSEN